MADGCSWMTTKAAMHGARGAFLRQGMADPSPAVLARDAEIVAAGEQLEADTGKRPTRKELADYVRRATGQSCSAGRVTQAYRRQREAEAAGTGEAVRMDRAPGAGRKKAPLVDAVVALCEAAIEVASTFDGLPHDDFVRPALRLRERDGWQEQLRSLAAAPSPPLPPEQLELQLDPLRRVREQLIAIKGDLDAARTDAERRQHRKSERECIALMIRLEPPEQADEITMSKGDAAEWARGGFERMRAAAQRVREEQVEQLRAEGLLDKADARRALRITRWLPKEDENETKRDT